jgi:hypothetical protein
MVVGGQDFTICQPNLPYPRAPVQHVFGPPVTMLGYILSTEQVVRELGSLDSDAI